MYRPALAKEKAKRSALHHLVDTFFNGSAEQAMAALLDDDSSRLSKSELKRLSLLVEEARKREASEEDDS